MRRIGFTGTQHGMTDAQKKTVQQLLSIACAHDAVEFHHGDCIGADAQAHKLATDLGCKTIVHPCDIEHKRAYCVADFAEPILPALTRNRVIVSETEDLIATPKQERVERHSGTWATVRYARSIGSRVTLVFPDGSTKVLPDTKGFLNG